MEEKKKEQDVGGEGVIMRLLGSGKSALDGFFIEGGEGGFYRIRARGGFFFIEGGWVGD